MNRNRSSKFKPKKSSISNISSHVPLTMTNKNDKTYSLTQASISTNATANAHIPLQPFSMNSKDREPKRSRTICQPNGTIPYTVDNTDTLEKVALRFNSTPSELLKLNKLNSRMIFPGQILFVPEERSSNDSDQQQSTTSSPAISPSALTKRKDEDAFILLTDPRLSNELSPPSLHHQSQQDVGPMIWSMTRHIAARPGRAQRLKSDISTESEPSPRTTEECSSTEQEDNSKQMKTLRKSSIIDDNQQLDEECLQRFIKLNVRLMTEDHRSVAGTLLVTPNAVMFDPDVLDPLIKEHGIDKYGLIIRMDLLAGISLYEDLAMYEHEATARDEEKRKMYRSTSVKKFQHNQSNTLFNTDEEQIHDLMMLLLDKIDKELNPSTSTDTCCMLFNASSTLHHHMPNNSSDNNNNNYDDDDDDDTFLSTSKDENFFDDSLQLSNALFQPLDDYKHSIGILHNDNDENKNINKNFNRIPSEGCQLENCVPLDQFHKRLNEIDKLLYKQQQNYITPHPIEIPYYLLIKTSMHIHDVPSLSAKEYKKSSERIIDYAYGKKRLEHEYWFSVPKEKCDHLYSFFLRWTPERELNPLMDDNDNQSKSNDDSLNRGFVLLANDDPELTDDYSTTKMSKDQRKNNEQEKHTHYLKRQNTLLKEWEIISVDEIYRRFNPNNNYDVGIPPPKLLHQSTLINEEQSKQILLELPIRVHALNWYMLFSTETNGFSLNQLYRRSINLDDDLPSLLIVKDVEQNVFGAFVSHRLMISEGFYGTGESFLFTFYPKFQVFNWSHANEFFVKGDINSLGFGSGEGTYGLWLDADLYHGRTCPSKTFNNEILTSNEDFIIASVEVWTFVD